MQTGCAGVFAGGDMVPFDRTVTTAVGHGKKAAQHIDAWLRSTATRRAGEARGRQRSRCCGSGITPKRRSAARARSTSSGGGRRSTRWSPGSIAAAARYEAQRCLSCGNCFECDGCYSACPEQAVIKLGPGRRYEYDFDKCTGCAICYDQCPCGAITMVPEPIATTAAERVAGLATCWRN